MSKMDQNGLPFPKGKDHVSQAPIFRVLKIEIHPLKKEIPAWKPIYRFHASHEKKPLTFH